MSLLGIDIGTTGCKVAAFSAGGRSLADAYREYATLHPQPGRAELDSRGVLECVWQAIGEVAAQTRGDPVTALCISSMGEAVTPVTADREILDNCILHVDIRGAEELDELLQGTDTEWFYEINPNILGPNYSLPKLLWLRKHQPDLYDRADKFLLWGDLVAFMLGCEPTTSFSLANRTLLFDIRKEDWSPELLELGGIEREKLPDCVSSGSITGTVSDAMAEKLGLPRGVAVVSGGHDQSCNSLGAGICRAGKAICGIGTVECITPAYDHIPEGGQMLERGLNVEHHILPGLYVSFIYNQSGTLVRWFRDTFAAADSKALPQGQDIYDALAAEMPEGPTRLLTLPYFEPTGAPHFIADASGVIAGLKMTTTRGEILKSIMESATFYFVESLDALKSIGIDTSSFVATGGGAKSDAWLQIKADVFGVPFIRPRITECGILGAAILAGVSTGVFKDPEEGIAQFVEHDRVFEPDQQRHRIYRELHGRYQRLYPAVKDLLGEL